jgi:hypothetical protein
MKKFIAIVRHNSGEFLGDVEQVKLGAWLAKNKFQVREWHADMVEVEPTPESTEFEHWVHSGWM